MRRRAWPGACARGARRIGHRLAAPVGVWDTDADGFRREFVAKVIVVDLYASEPPACRGADYVWAAKDELDGSVLHATEATVVRYAPTVLTQCERRLGRGAIQRSWRCAYSAARSSWTRGIRRWSLNFSKFSTEPSCFRPRFAWKAWKNRAFT